MTFDELIGAIPETFLDGSVQRLHAGEKPEDIGDSIPVFIYQELRETFDPEASEEEQLEMALDMLIRGSNEIQQAIGYIQRKFA
jgi:hypothetical protein